MSDKGDLSGEGLLWLTVTWLEVTLAHSYFGSVSLAHTVEGIMTGVCWSHGIHRQEAKSAQLTLFILARALDNGMVQPTFKVHLPTSDNLI